MHVFITGITAGLGKAMAEQLLEQGHHVSGMGRRQERLEEMRQKWSQRPLIVYCGDVTVQQDVCDAVAAAKREHGPIDIVMANAGFGVAGAVEDLSPDDFHRQFKTNIDGVLHTIYATLDDLKETKGQLVLLGSILSYFSTYKNAPYSMSKFAIKALAESLEGEWKDYGICVSFVAPGLLGTEIRRVDNQGHYRPKAKDRAPEFLVMDVQKAAKQVLDGVMRRKKEIIVTFHGHILLFLNRFFPFFLKRLKRYI